MKDKQDTQTQDMFELLAKLENFCYAVASEDTRLYNMAKMYAYEIEDLLDKVRGETQ